MDPLSVASGVAGLISLAIDVGQIASDYCIAVKNAPKDIQELREEFISLSHILEQLKAFLESESCKGKSFDKTSVLCCAVGSCKDKVATISEKLKRSDGGRLSKMVDRLHWPFQQNDVLQMVETLRRYIQTFQFSLTIEGW